MVFRFIGKIWGCPPQGKSPKRGFTEVACTCGMELWMSMTGEANGFRNGAGALSVNLAKPNMKYHSGTLDYFIYMCIYIYTVYIDTCMCVCVCICIYCNIPIYILSVLFIVLCFFRLPWVPYRWTQHGTASRQHIKSNHAISC
jgi:hypothetical protein